MKQAEAQRILDKIVEQVFGYKNPYALQEFQEKYAFDVRLPYQVKDSIDDAPTWVQSKNPTKYMHKTNITKRAEKDDWLMPHRSLESIEDVLDAWDKVNYTTTEQTVDSLNVGESANVYDSENVFHSLDVDKSKNILFSDGINNSEFLAASQRTTMSSFCIRSEDSTTCSNSFSVTMCEKVTNGFFIHDSVDLMDCIFCSHLTGKRFCIANIQFSEEEYKKLAPMIIQWILEPST